MTRKTLPRKLSPATPRRVEVRAIVHAKIALGLALAVAAPVVLGYASHQQARVDQALALRGEIATATFEKLIRTQRDRNSPRSYEIHYQFSPSENAGLGREQGDAWVTEAFYSGLSAHPEFVVRYDSEHPEISSPVYAGMEATRWPELTTMMVWSVVVDLGLLTYFVGLPLLKLRKDLRLLRWGVATRAKIVSKSVGTGRSGNYLSLNYEFVDGAGQTVSGWRILWEGIGPSGGSTHPEIRAALENPTVIYDPGNSRAHLLYPSPVAQIRR
jgi:hypothetical protein